MQRFLVPSFLAVLLAAGAAAQDLSDVTVEPTHVAGPVHMLTGAGGNLAVSVGDDGVLLVDSQFAPLAPRIKQAIADLGGELRFVLNTHFHGDHTDGNPEFNDAPIFSHVNVRKRLMEGTERADGDTEPAPEDAWPVVTFEQSVSIHFNGEEIMVRHYPRAHTDGDAVVYFSGSDVVHMGDILFHDRFPYVDLEAGGSVDGVLAAVQSVIDWVGDDTVVLMGHGTVAAVADLHEFLAMIRDTRATVDAGLEAGTSVDDLVAAGLPGYESWDWQFISTERWIRTLAADRAAR